MQGILLSEAGLHTANGEVPRRCWKVDQNFDSVTRWAHDEPPRDTGFIPQALEWFQIAQAIHDSSFDTDILEGSK